MFIQKLGVVYLDRRKNDRVVWIFSKSGEFFVKFFCFELAKEDNLNYKLLLKIIWQGVIFFRIEVFVWLAVLLKIKVKCRFMGMGII